MDSPGQVLGLGAIAITVIGLMVWAFKYLLQTMIPAMMAANAKALDEQRQQLLATMAEQRQQSAITLSEQRKACEDGQKALAELIREGRRQSGEEHATLLTTARDLHGLVMDRLNVGFREIAAEMDMVSEAVRARRRQGAPQQPPIPPQRSEP